MADPTKIGKYQILERIGRGGMGYVYRAMDPILKREVALKTMLKDLSSDEELRTRFSREAQSAGGLRHPNIVTIYDLGEDDDHCPYIAMEFLTGTDLENVIKNKIELPLLKKLDIIMQTCEGLAYAHSKGIIHRDIKPANIRLLDNGEVKIMDFGIAKIAASHFTRTGMIMGTPHYMSPEQIRGEKVDGRADIFSVGVVLFELLVSRKPFPGENPTAVLFKIIHQEPERLADENFNPPEGLEEIISRALAKKPENRYQTCQEMLADLLQMFDRLKDTETIQPTLIVDKPYTAIAINKTLSPRKSTPLPRPAGATTPPPTLKKSEGSDLKQATPSPVAATVKKEPVATQTVKIQSREDLPPISPTPVPSEARKWVLLASSGVLGIALVVVLFFMMIRKVTMEDFKIPKVQSKALQAKPATPQNVQKPISVPPPQTEPPAVERKETVAGGEITNEPVPAAEAPAAGWVALNIQPWAEIEGIKDSEGNSKSASCSITPCRIELLPGSYDITLHNAQFQDLTVHVEVRSNETTTVNRRMEGFDYAKAIESLGL